MIRRFYSWLCGLKIGQRRISMSTPFMIGHLGHCLPPEIWGKELRSAARYCVDVHEWDGFNWRFIETLQLTEEELFKTSMGSKVSSNAIAVRPSVLIPPKDQS